MQKTSQRCQMSRNEQWTRGNIKVALVHSTVRFFFVNIKAFQKRDYLLYSTYNYTSKPLSKSYIFYVWQKVNSTNLTTFHCIRCTHQHTFPSCFQKQKLEDDAQHNHIKKCMRRNLTDMAQRWTNDIAFF